MLTGWTELVYAFGDRAFVRPSDDYVIAVGHESEVRPTASSEKDRATAIYNRMAYGYGTSTHPERCRPKVIFVAETEADVIAVLQTAYKNKAAVSVRTGGHHYGCASSTSGDGVQLDVKPLTRKGFAPRVTSRLLAQPTYDYTDCTMPTYDVTTNTVTTGVGLKLVELAGWLGQLKRPKRDGAGNQEYLSDGTPIVDVGAFVAHGECGTVHVGGHAQSGGYSPFCGRSFGYFVDHIVSMTYILPPRDDTLVCEKVTIRAPDPARPHARNDEMWWACRGGAPGAFGVLLEIQFKPIWDADHPYSSTQFYVASYDYEGKNIRTMLSIVNKYSEDKNLRNDFNLWCGTIAGNPPLDSYNTCIDAKMSCDRGETGPRGKEEVVKSLPMIVLAATYTNLGGIHRTSGEAADADAFFDYLERHTGCAFVNSVAMGADNAIRLHSAQPRLMRLMSTLMPMLGGGRVPLSLGAIATATLGLARLQNNPYTMCVYTSNEFDLTQRRTPDGSQDFLEWNVAAIQELMIPKGRLEWYYQQHRTGLYADYQWLVMGGKMREPQDNAVPFRSSQYMVFLYNHYDICDPKAEVWARLKALVQRDGSRDTKEYERIAHEHMERVRAQLVGTKEKNWTDGMLGTNQQMAAFPNGLGVLEDHIGEFFDSRAKYLRLLRLKRAIDPADVLTPNTWMVGSARKHLGRADPADL